MIKNKDYKEKITSGQKIYPQKTTTVRKADNFVVLGNFETNQK